MKQTTFSAGRALALLLAMGALSVPIGATTVTNLVVNGGFEGGVDGNGNPTGWIYTPAYTDPSAFVSTSSPNSGTHDFQFSSCCGGNTVHQQDDITQSIPTTPGELYILSVYEEDFDPGGPRGVQYFWNGQGSTLFPEVPHPQGFDYMQFTFEVVGGPGTSSTLSFEGYDVRGIMYIDDVSVTPASDVTAPEPGTVGMLAAGGVGLALFGFFRKK